MIDSIRLQLIRELNMTEEETHRIRTRLQTAATNCDNPEIKQVWYKKLNEFNLKQTRGNNEKIY